MKTIFSTLCIVWTVFSLNCFSQNYRPFVYDNTSFFQFSDKIETFRETPSGFVPDPRGYAINLLQGWNTGSFSCNPHDGMTWAGPRFTQGSLPNTYYFYNKNNEPLTFKTTKNVGEVWTFYTYSNGNYVEATISNKELLTFLELTDSVKTISLQLKTSSGTAVADDVNSITYKLSKNYGLLQVTRFLDFPTATASGNLIGMTAPEKGFQMISSRDIFNFSIGDEFHYDSLYVNTHTNQKVSIKTINLISGIYRSANTDTVIYTIDQQKETHILNTQTNEESFAYTTATVKEKHLLSTTQLYPEQANLNAEPFLSNAHYSLSLFADDNSRSQWNTNGEIFIYNTTPTTCWSELMYDPMHYYSYLEGCGLLSDDQYNWGGTSRYKHLVYFKKGSQIWGDALVITSSTTKEEHADLALFPNPLRQGESLHYNTGNFKVIDVRIYNASGNTLELPAFSSSTLDVSNFAAGLYIVQFMNDKNEYISAKLVIK